jgi:hypothetical protein
LRASAGTVANHIGGIAVLKYGWAEIFPPVGAMSPRHACLSRPRRLPRPAHSREKPGFWVWDGEIPRDADCPLEEDGFEPSVPRVGSICLDTVLPPGAVEKACSEKHCTLRGTGSSNPSSSSGESVSRGDAALVGLEGPEPRVRSLAAQAQSVLGQDPFSGHVFCFRGRRGDLVKLLWWDGDPPEVLHELPG